MSHRRYTCCFPAESIGRFEVTHFNTDAQTSVSDAAIHKIQRTRARSQTWQYTVDSPRRQFQVTQVEYLV
jgi:hypothetical protein